MNRRDFSAGLAMGAVTASSGIAAPAIAQARKELRMVTSWPKNFPGVGVSAERLAQAIGDATEGRIRVRVYAAGELVPPFEVFSAVSGGTADIYHSAAFYWQGRSPAFNFFASVPFGMTRDELDAWMYFNGGQQLWDELAAQFNLKPFMGGNPGVQMTGWFRREVKSLDDIKGLKIRMPGLGGEVMRRIGAAAVALPPQEIYSALQSGAIDAAEWIGPWNDLAFGFHRIAKFYYGPGWHEPGTVTDISFNKKTWDSLSATDRFLIESLIRAEHVYSSAEFHANNGEALRQITEQHGVRVLNFPTDVIKALGTASRQALTEFSDRDAFTKKVYDSYSKSLRLSMAWSRVGDESYLAARAAAFGN